LSSEQSRLVFDQRANRTPKPKAAKQLGVLLPRADVGESIIGVVLSAIVVVLRKGAAACSGWPRIETAGNFHWRRRLRVIGFLPLSVDFLRMAATNQHDRR